MSEHAVSCGTFGGVEELRAEQLTERKNESERSGKTAIASSNEEGRQAGRAFGFISLPHTLPWVVHLERLRQYYYYYYYGRGAPAQ